MFDNRRTPPIGHDGEDPVEEDFVAILASLDEALVSGSVDASAADATSQPQVAEGLEGALDCLKVLEQAWPRATSTESGARDDPPIPPGEGRDCPKFFGRYRVVRQLGQGGGGVVFLAIDPALGREVALKLPRPDALLSPETRRRFLGEATMAARLDHPNLVPVYEAGEVGPVCYIASAYCRGINLADWCRRRRGPEPPGAAAAVVASLAEAVDHAHRRGVLHRDIKPSNILLVPRHDVATGNAALDRDYLLKLTDFGLARNLGGPGGETRSGTVLGTPEYMSPEQASGRSRDLGPQTDVYGLGVLLYELLTNRPPLRADSDLGTLRLVLSEEPVSPRRLRPGVPRDLEVICLKCLEKDPRRRYGTAIGLAYDLRRFLQGQSIIARPVGICGRFRRWCQREPTLAVSTALTAVLLLGLALGSVCAAVVFRAMAHRQRALRITEATARRELEFNLNSHRIARAHLDWRAGDVEGMRRHLAECPSELRNWEWFYLSRLGPSTPLCLDGHANLVHGVAISPDGRHVASAAAGKEPIRIWDSRTGRQVMTLPGDPIGTLCLAYSPDGVRIASAGCGPAIVIREVATGREVAALHGHEGAIKKLAYSPDGARIASAAEDGTTRLWDLRDGRHVRTMSAPAMAAGLAFHPDGTRIATVGGDGSVRVWEAASGQEILAFHGHRGRAHGVAFSPDGVHIASAGEDKAIRLWESRSGHLVRSFNGHSGLLTGIAFGADGAQLASASEDGEAKIWDIASGRELRGLTGHADAVRDVAFFPDGTRIASAGADYTVRIWEIDRGRDSLLLGGGHSAAIMDVACSPDGRTIASASRDGTIALRDAATDRVTLTLAGHERVVYGLAFHPREGLLASAGGDGLVRIWDLASGRESRALRVEGTSVYRVAFHPGGRLLATAGYDGIVRVWDFATGARRRAFRANDGPIRGLAYSPDGGKLATSGEGGEVKVWRPESDLAPQVLLGHSGTVSDVAFSADGTRITSAGFDRSIRVWDAGTGRQVWKLLGHTGFVTGVAFSPDGTRLASAGWDGGVRLWDLATGEQVIVLGSRGVRTRGVRFSPDGHRIIAGNSDATLEVWDSSRPDPSRAQVPRSGPS